MLAGRGKALALAFLDLAPFPEMAGSREKATGRVEFGEVVDVLEAVYPKPWSSEGGRARVRRTTGEEGWVSAVHLKPRAALVAAVAETVSVSMFRASPPTRFLRAGTLVIATDCGEDGEVQVIEANGNRCFVAGEALTLAPKEVEAARALARRNEALYRRDDDTPDFGSATGRLVTVVEPVEATTPSPTAGTTRVPAGTLLLATDQTDVDTGVSLPGGSAARILNCYVSDDATEVAVAKALARSRRLRSTGALAESKAVKVKAHADFPEARLLGVLNGRAAAPPSCPRLRFGSPDVVQARPHGPNGIEVLGPTPEARAPSVYDWKALAAADLPGFVPDEPLPLALRTTAATARRRELATRNQEMGPSPPPRLHFTVPASAEVGVTYAFDPVTWRSPSLIAGQLVGYVYPRVDCDGCDLAPRRYDGAVRAVTASARALLVWSPREVTWSNWKAVPSERLIAEDATVAYTAESSSGVRVLKFTSNRSLGQIEGAWSVTLNPGNHELLLVRASRPGWEECDRLSYLFSASDELELVGGGEDCG